MLLSDQKTWERLMFLLPVHCTQAFSPTRPPTIFCRFSKDIHRGSPGRTAPFLCPSPMFPNSCLWPPPIHPSLVLLALAFRRVSLEMDIRPTSPLALHTPTPQADTNMWNTTSLEVAYNGVKGRFSILCCQFPFLHWLQGGPQLI